MYFGPVHQSFGFVLIISHCPLVCERAVVSVLLVSLVRYFCRFFVIVVVYYWNEHSNIKRQQTKKRQKFVSFQLSVCPLVCERALLT